jgi:hypothetical protein
MGGNRWVSLRSTHPTNRARALISFSKRISDSLATSRHGRFASSREMVPFREQDETLVQQPSSYLAEGASLGSDGRRVEI